MIMTLFAAPELDEADRVVVDLVQAQHRALRPLVATPRRWTGLLRKVALARAVQGSNTIEGFTVSMDDAFAAIDDQEPVDADELAWRAVRGYRDAMTYVLQLAQEGPRDLSPHSIKALHFMMQHYDLGKWPGRWRPDQVYVYDESSGRTVYAGPDALLIPPLMDELVVEINAADPSLPALVHAAMAHLNLVMIHPFKDGNGRMARCLQTLVLAGEGTLASEFSSIEEYLGQHAPEYCNVLAEVGQGSWNPARDTRPWIRFCLTAHHRQALQVARRAELASKLWAYAEEQVAEARVPERCVDALTFSLSGFALRNASYRQLHPDISQNLASRDLNEMVKAGLLDPIGERRGRKYRPVERLRMVASGIRHEVDQAFPVNADPYRQVREPA
jgi:Fic family protein